MNHSSEQGQQAFEQLLTALSSDREIASTRYQELRLKLIRFLTLRGVVMATEAADEALDRVAVKVAEGKEIENLNWYSFGVARLVGFEFLREQASHVQISRSDDLADIVSTSEDEDSLLKFLKECLDELNEENRRLVLDYYSMGVKDKVNREEIARRRGASLNHLRLQVFRLKKILRNCVEGKKSEENC